MEQRSFCFQCSKNIKNPQTFSCGHTYCTNCTCRLLLFHHFFNLYTNEQVQIECKCHLGIKEFLLQSLYDMLLTSSYTNSCYNHINIPTSHYCSKCDKWLCDNCTEIHNIVNPEHHLVEEILEMVKCKQHQEVQDVCCIQCEEDACEKCFYLNQQHYGHTKIPIMEYAYTLRNNIQINAYSDISTRLDQILVNIKDHFQSTFAKCEQLIQILDEAKNVYTKKMQIITERAELLINILKILYFNLDSDLKNSAKSLDINFLRDLISTNINFNLLEIRDETGKKAQQLLEYAEDLFKYLSTMRQPINIRVSVAKSWQNTHTLLGHKSFVCSLLQLKDGNIASGSGDSTIKIWEAKQKVFSCSFILTGHRNSVYSLILLKDGRLASGSDDKTIKIWEVNKTDVKNYLTLLGHTDYVRSLIQLTDGRIVSGSIGGTIKFWEISEKNYQNTLTITGHTLPVRTLLQLKDDRIASGSDDTTIKIWEVKTSDVRNTLTLTGHLDYIRSIIQMRDGRIASGSNDSTINIWEVTEIDFANTITLTGHTDYISTLVQLKDEKIASGSIDGSIKIWEVFDRNYKNIATITGHNSYVLTIIQLTDGRIVSGSDDKSIKVWA